MTNQKYKEPYKHSLHLHVDNGGHTFEVSGEDNGDGLYILNVGLSNSFYGYASNEIKMYVWENGKAIRPESLREIGLFFLKCADEVDALEKVK